MDKQTVCCRVSKARYPLNVTYFWLLKQVAIARTQHKRWMFLAEPKQ